VPDIPATYRRIEGSERRPMSGAKRVGPADPAERLSVSVYVHMRPGSHLPDLNYWMSRRRNAGEFLSHQLAAELYGAEQSDLDRVVAFAHANGLKIDHVSPPRRLVQLSGEVVQMNKAFSVDLGRYESPSATYRGREGYVYLPQELIGIVQGVFGLDNRPVVTAHATPTQVAQLYDFPPGSAAGQTIAIPEFGGGFAQADVNFFFTGQGLTAPPITVVSVDGATNTLSGSFGNVAFPPGSDFEVMLDICVAGAVAQGADIVVYFAPNTQQGTIDAYSEMITDAANNPSVISVSWGGNETNLTLNGQFQIALLFPLAATRGVTILAATGDDGTNNKTNDGSAHVQFPASSPWVTACGGSNITSRIPLIERTWSFGPLATTGGGVSNIDDLPPYQVGIGVPPSVNDGVTIGRGIPDVAGHAGGYNLVVYGRNTNALTFTSPPANSGSLVGPIGGTSAVAPLYAGLVARVNAALGRRIGLLTPALYLIGGAPWVHVFRDIADGLTNGVSFPAGAPTPTGSSPGYSSGTGWDACTGWGVVDGTRLREALVLGAKINKKDSTPDPPAACAGIPGSSTVIQLFWKANDGSHSIFTSASNNGINFGAGFKINGVDKTSKSPAACLFNHRLFLFWKSDDRSNRILVSSSTNGTSWPAGVAINGADRTQDSPVVCVFLEHLFLFWKADDSSDAILVSKSADGQTFPAGQRINNSDSTPQAPSACVFKNRLFLYWKANDASNLIFVASSTDGLTFPKGRSINDFDATPNSPAVCVVDDQVFLFWRSLDDHNIFWSVSTDGIHWPPGRKINYPDGASDSPVPITSNKTLFLYWKSDDSDNSIYVVNWPFDLFRPLGS
jgi:kumamolisin